MNNKAFTVSLIVAILSFSMVYSFVTSTETSIKEKYGPDVNVVVASKDIKELDTLDATNLDFKSLPKSFAEPGTSDKKDAFIGGLAAAPIMAGEQITRSKVSMAGVQSGLARQVAVGKRGFAVKVSDESSVAKLIKPGDRVDVLTNVDLSAGNKALAEVHTILQDVLVLATGKYITNTVPGILETDPYKSSKKSLTRLGEYNSYTNVTLEVDPSEVQTLVYAQANFGGVYLSLRNNDDSKKEELNRTMAPDVIGTKGAAAIAKPAPGGGR